MSEVKDAGGPAFPMPDVLIQSVSELLENIKDEEKRSAALEQLGERATGMTLRDHFAAKAMQAYCSRKDWTIDMSQRDTADCAYQMADAMLEARK
jgi:hypothetical protein